MTAMKLDKRSGNPMEARGNAGQYHKKVIPAPGTPRVYEALLRALVLAWDTDNVPQFYEVLDSARQETHCQVPVSLVNGELRRQLREADVPLPFEGDH